MVMSGDVIRLIYARTYHRPKCICFQFILNRPVFDTASNNCPNSPPAVQNTKFLYQRADNRVAPTSIPLVL